jgi:hypothetical protein
MGMLLGFAAGYVLGARSGSDGLEDLRRAWKAIAASEEVRDLLAGGLSTARDMVSIGRQTLAQRLAPSSGGPQRRAA